MYIPKYASRAGTYLPETSMGEDLLQVILDTSVEEAMEYGDVLVKEGFTRKELRTLSAGSDALTDNFYACYVREDMHLFHFYESSLHASRILAAPPLPLPEPSLLPRVTDPSVTQLPISVVGMNYVVQLPDGRFVMVDGGRHSEADEQMTYRFLCKRSGGKPVIALWMFTHADIDHVDHACNFLKTYGDRVTVEGAAYFFPDCSKLDMYADYTEAEKNRAMLAETLAAYAPKAVVYTLRTGQVFSFTDAQIQILYTASDTYPMVYTSANDLSAAWRFTFAGGRSFVVLGDPVTITSRQIAHTYGDRLKSDVLQIAHHGLLGGDTFLYQCIDPEICFWPVWESRFLGKFPDQRYQYCIGEGGCDYNAWIRKAPHRRHYSNGTPITVTFPADGSMTEKTEL